MSDVISISSKSSESSIACVSSTVDKFPEDSNNRSPPLSALTPDEKEILSYSPSNQQTLNCDWYQRLINKKRRLTESETQDLPRSTSTSNHQSLDGNIVFSMIDFF